MPGKKKNVQALKKELIDNLDQFLFDNGEIDEDIAEQEKKKALAELDKLIKQDLSEAKIMSSMKQIEEDIKDSVGDNNKAGQSAHVLDLRKVEEPQIAKDKKWFKLSSIRQKKVKPVEEELHIPKKEKKDFNFVWPSLALTGALSKVIVFALVLAIVLLPIRGLELFGKISDDKDLIIDYGKQGLVSLQTGVISASENSYDVAQSDFELALDNFNKAQGVLNEYHNWMLNAASLTPVVGKPLSLSRNMLSVATNISEAATILNKKVQQQENLTEYLVVINNQIEATIPYLEQANKDLDGISTYALPSDLRPYFDGLKVYLPETIDNLYTLNEVFPTLIQLLGHDAEQRYLVLFQNNNELRASGGFIGSIALFDVYQGKIVNLEIPKGGAYDLEYGQKVKVKAPQALSLINPYFNIWDANWWSDFPKSAQKVIDFYEDTTDSSVNGAIAINAEVLKELLYVLGPITLEEYNLTITADNVFSVIQEEVELNYDKEENEPKAVIADLVPIVLEKLLTASEEQKEIVAVLVNMLATKDIQIYSVDETLQQELSKLVWSGEVVVSDKDYLSVINTNIGGGKTDNDVYQTIDHQAKIEDNGDIINTVRVTRANHGDKDNPFAGIEGGNVSYLRIYVPLGSEFLEAIGFDDLPLEYFHSAAVNAKTDEDILKEEDGKMIDGLSNTEIYTSLDKTVFANWMMLAPGETKTVSIKYKLPFQLDLGDPLVINWWQNIFKGNQRLDNYNLVVQSQSGAKNTIFNSSVLLPDNLKVVWNNASDEDKMSINDNLVTYSQELNRDQYFGFIIATQ